MREVEQADHHLTGALRLPLDQPEVVRSAAPARRPESVPASSERAPFRAMVRMPESGLPSRWPTAAESRPSAARVSPRASCSRVSTSDRVRVSTFCSSSSVEGVQLGPRGPQRADHLAEVGGQEPQLAAEVGRGRLLQVVEGDAPGGRDQRRDRLHQPATGQPPEGQAERRRRPRRRRPASSSGSRPAWRRRRRGSGRRRAPRAAAPRWGGRGSRRPRRPAGWRSGTTSWSTRCPPTARCSGALRAPRRAPPRRSGRRRTAVRRGSSVRPVSARVGGEGDAAGVVEQPDAVHARLAPDVLEDPVGVLAAIEQHGAVDGAGCGLRHQVGLLGGLLDHEPFEAQLGHEERGHHDQPGTRREEQQAGGEPVAPAELVAEVVGKLRRGCAGRHGSPPGE